MLFRPDLINGSFVVGAGAAVGGPPFARDGPE